jgi:hypothetical protein
VTEFETRCSILAELWLNYRGDEGFESFIEYNDLGLPLAYLISSDIVKPNAELATGFINETFELLMAALELEEDFGFASLDEMLNSIE